MSATSVLRQLTRLPYARITVFSRRNLDENANCNWCGAREKLRKFEFHSDDGGIFELRGTFCSPGCCRAYHDLNRKWGEL